MKALDVFAGTGVGVACQRLGIEEFGVEIWDPAVATREAAGMVTSYLDAWEIELAAGLEHDMEWFSPPCQTFSVAGRGTGRKALDNVVSLIEDGAWKNIDVLRKRAESLGDDRTGLVLTPLSYAYRYRPTYVALEQVPTVLPIWEAMRPYFAVLGYSVWTGILNSVDYDVPQSRKRAYLIARRDGLTARPPKTKRFEGSMADVLGWGLTDRVSPTLTGHLGVTRSPSGTQGIYLDAIERGAFIFKPVPPKASTVARNGIGSKFAPNTVNVDVNEGGLLQTYPDGFPFQGNSSEKQLQVGNAVPPKVAEAVLRGFM